MVSDHQQSETAGEAGAVSLGSMEKPATASKQMYAESEEEEEEEEESTWERERRLQKVSVEGEHMGEVAQATKGECRSRAHGRGSADFKR